jgi:CRISPR/Cas system-associated exonuclease Cas4 (RecB family)
MDRGSLFHEMLELHYKMQMEDKHSNEIILAVTESAREKYRNDEYPDFEMVESCVSNYQAYAIHYASDGWEPVAVETPFSKVLFENDQHKIVIEGIIDLIVKNNSGQVYPVDHKTSEKRDFYPTILVNQFFAYVWATETNVFVKNDIGFQKTLGPAERFARPMLNYTPELIAEWREDVIYDGLNLINFIEKGIFPRRKSSCFRCSFRQICESTPDAREWKIKSKYTVGEAYDIYNRSK